MRGNRILERLTAQDCNTPHSCDYRYSALKAKIKVYLKSYNFMRTDKLLII